MATQPPPLQVRYVDLPDLGETFSDSIHSMIWDGQMLRVEFCATRFQQSTSGGQAEATRYPACRLVLTGAAATDLANRLQQTITALRDAVGQTKAPTGNPPATAMPPDTPTAPTTTRKQ